MKIITSLLCMLSASLFGQTFGGVEFGSGFSSPVAIVNAGDSRLFVVEQTGAIKILNSDGTVNEENFLTLTETTIVIGSEQGLLGLAFHPDYAQNGLFYVNYTRAGDESTVVARYSVSADPDIANPNSGFPLLTVPQPFSNHNGGTLQFGPDGYLYIGMGDGGSGGDPGNRAQNIDENLGKMLRIDVDGTPPYGIPNDNPFVGTDGNDEIWAIGLRNPWKFSFDRMTGELWIADVGQQNIEEINRVSAGAAGINYGWKCYEGSAVFSACGAGPEYTFPVAEYTHNATDGCSVTGGYVYRGTAYPNLVGRYFFADYCKDQIGMYMEGSGITFGAGSPGYENITSFGEDANGELYFVSSEVGVVYRLVDTSMGTEDFSSNGISLYPNPASSEFNIKTAGPTTLAKLHVYDITGKLLIERKLSELELQTVDSGSLQAGMYLVTVEDNAGARYSSRLTIR